jgi:hypothetical protein
MFARWRILALLTLLITVVWVVRPLAPEPTRTGDERISQAGEIGTLLVRRSEGPSLDSGSDDDGPAHPPMRAPALEGSVGDADPAAPRPAARRSVDRVGSPSPRGPPLLVV